MQKQDEILYNEIEGLEEEGRFLEAKQLRAQLSDDAKDEIDELETIRTIRYD